MATAKKRITLLAQKGSRLTQRKKPVRATHVSSTGKTIRTSVRKKVVQKKRIVHHRKKNPTQAERGAVAQKWAAWGAAHKLTAAKINEGAYVIKSMPDPTRIKDFSALAQMLGVRGTNPVTNATNPRAGTRKRTIRKPSGAGGNWAVATQVSPGKFRIARWYKEQDAAVDAAEKAGLASGKPVYVLDRAKYNALTR